MPNQDFSRQIRAFTANPRGAPPPAGRPLRAATCPERAEPAFFAQYLEPEPPAEPGAAFLWVAGDRLHVLGVMQDSDPFSKAGPKNDSPWRQGDVLEFFFRAAGRSEYVELHIAPNQATLELRLPFAGEHDINNLFFASGMCAAATEFSADGIKGWHGHMAIPLATIGISTEARGVVGRAAVCRYNYNRPWGPRPELSSTTAFSLPGFHQPDCWHELVIET